MKNQYFTNLFEGISSVFEGMSITLASMFVRPVTVQYPDVDPRSDESLLKGGYKGPMAGMYPNYRGILHVNMDICTACTLCMKACPIDCIAITNVKCEKTKVIGTDGKEATKTRTCTRFDIDIAKCMFCGLCVVPCPTGAIAHSNEFHWNMDNLNDLVKRFVTAEEAQAFEQAAADLEEKEKAEKVAKAAKAKKEAEAGEAGEGQEKPKPAKKPKETTEPEGA